MTAVHRLTCLLSPLPRLPDTFTEVTLVAEVKPQLLVLRAIFDVESYAANLVEINKYQTEVLNGKHDTYKMFTSSAGGRKVLAHLKEIYMKENQKAAALDRIACLCRTGEPTQEKLIRLDEELSAFGFDAAPEAHVAALGQMLREQLKKACADVVSSTSETLQGIDSVVYANRKPEQFQSRSEGDSVLAGPHHCSITGVVAERA